MLNRRTLLAVGAAALATGAAGAAAPRRLPRGACDCHTHVFPDPARYPFAPGRIYTPPVASVAQLQAHLDALHLDRVVIVSPSVYGTDLSATRDAIAALGQHRARGVSVLVPGMSGKKLDRLHAAGFRGMRLNLHTAGVTDPGEARRILAEAARQIGGRPWHVQLYAPLPLLLSVRDVLESYAVPLVFDHFAGADGRLGPEQPGFAMIADLVRAGRAHVKISAPYRAFGPDAKREMVERLVRAFVAVNPARMLWASDWPHSGALTTEPLAATDIRPNYVVDDRQWLADVMRWTSRAEQRAMLVDNPARLYGFS